MKEGDSVIVRTSWMSSRDKVHAKVKRITSTGKIRLEDGRLFDKNGKHNERGWGIMWLEEKR